jgi:hypothetical protein
MNTIKNVLEINNLIQFVEMQIYFTIQKYIIFKPKSSKKKNTNQNPSRYDNNSIITKSQVSTQARKSIFQKSWCKNRPIIRYLARGPKSP